MILAQKTYVEWLLSLNPDERPTATEIMDSELLKDYRITNPRAKITRIRTISSGSNGSVPNIQTRPPRNSNSNSE